MAFGYNGRSHSDYIKDLDRIWNGHNHIEIEMTGYSTSTHEDKPKDMKLSTIAKRLLDKDTKTLAKAGYIDSELNITRHGWDKLKALIFEANKTELVKMATEELEEEKESK